MTIVDAKVDPDRTDSPTYGEEILPGMKLVRNMERKDADSKYKSTPDMSCYDNSVDTRERLTQYDKMNFFAEFKRDKAYNPFRDPKDDVQEVFQNFLH